MLGIREHTLLGNVVGLCWAVHWVMLLGLGQHTSLGNVVGQHTLLGNVVGLCWALSNTLYCYWVILLVYCWFM
jgi:hypothetical protein